jgi:hypothetical protein
MKWPDFLFQFAERPLFHSSMLKIFSSEKNPSLFSSQLEFWIKLTSEENSNKNMRVGD